MRLQFARAACEDVLTRLSPLVTERRRRRLRVLQAIVMPAEQAA